MKVGRVIGENIYETVDLPLDVKIFYIGIHSQAGPAAWNSFCKVLAKKSNFKEKLYS